jgi:hypothetical protein
MAPEVLVIGYQDTLTLNMLKDFLIKKVGPTKGIKPQWAEMSLMSSEPILAHMMDNALQADLELLVVFLQFRDFHEDSRIPEFFLDACDEAFRVTPTDPARMLKESEDSGRVPVSSLWLSYLKEKASQ